MIALPLVGLDVLVIALWTIAAALAIALIMNKLGGILGGVPYLGGKLESAASGMAQAITNACGTLLGGIDKLIGAAWAHLAHYMSGLFSQFIAHSALIAHLAEIVAGSLYRVSGLKAIVHNLSRAVHVVLHRFTAIGREVYNLRKRVKTLEHDISKGIGHDLRIHIKALEKWEKAAKAQLAADAQAITQTLPGELTQLENFIKAIPGTKYLDWAAGVVTAALGLEIFNLFRCPSLLNSAKKRGCGLWNGLEDLLGLFVDTFLLTNVCEILPFLESAVSEVADPIVVGLTEVGAGLCSGGIGAAPPLHTPALSLPANPGVTLHLP